MFEGTPLQDRRGVSMCEQDADGAVRPHKAIGPYIPKHYRWVSFLRTLYLSHIPRAIHKGNLAKGVHTMVNHIYIYIYGCFRKWWTLK